MGFLHEGHLALVRQAKTRAELVVVSIFVNPAQFNNAEDLAKYPRDFQRDQKLLEQEKVDILFMPHESEVYPPADYPQGKPEIMLDYPRLSSLLCGAHRPGHFQGMLLIVHNLFLWVKPHLAIFGLKDYQQYLLVKKMSHDLRLGVEIIGGELVRESRADLAGLALSSRNARLSESGKTRALAISRALFRLRENWGKQPLARLKTEFLADLGDLELEYATFCHPQTLEECPDYQGETLAAVAAWVDGIRLIDNLLLPSPGPVQTV